jgi:hypothetical protein
MLIPVVTSPDFAPKIVKGYHGCSREAAKNISDTEEWLPSQKAFDWLGIGIYFWEYAPFRAWEWAEDQCKRKGGEPVVLEAMIQLGLCLNLLDIGHHAGLPEAYKIIKERHDKEAKPLPRNTNMGAHFLDQEVVNLYCNLVEEGTGTPYQSVRGCFPEGNPLYDGSKLLSKTHVQIAVRDPLCITNIGILERNAL